MQLIENERFTDEEIVLEGDLDPGAAKAWVVLGM